MFKLIKNINKFTLYKTTFSGETVMLGKFNKDSLLNYWNTECKKWISPDPSIDTTKEMNEAIHMLYNVEHNVAEFGIKGAFTVCYYDEAHKEWAVH